MDNEKAVLDCLHLLQRGYGLDTKIYPVCSIEFRAFVGIITNSGTESYLTKWLPLKALQTSKSGAFSTLSNKLMQYNCVKSVSQVWYWNANAINDFIRSLQSTWVEVAQKNSLDNVCEIRTFPLLTNKQTRSTCTEPATVLPNDMEHGNANIRKFDVQDARDVTELHIKLSKIAGNLKLNHQAQAKWESEFQNIIQAARSAIDKRAEIQRKNEEEINGMLRSKQLPNDAGLQNANIYDDSSDSMQNESVDTDESLWSTESEHQYVVSKSEETLQQTIQGAPDKEKQEPSLANDGKIIKQNGYHIMNIKESLMVNVQRMERLYNELNSVRTDIETLKLSLEAATIFQIKMMEIHEEDIKRKDREKGTQFVEKTHMIKHLLADQENNNEVAIQIESETHNATLMTEKPLTGCNENFRNKLHEILMKM